MTPPLSIQTDVLMIGSGISGLYTALKLSKSGRKVLLVTKSALAENNSRYAQGGIAVVLPENTEDSLEQHVQDTLRAGAGLCDEAIVRTILAEGHAAIEDLLALGVPFDRYANQHLAFTREAAHSVPRIIHAGGDATGRSVEMTLIRQVQADPNIQTLEHTLALDLRVEADRCLGAALVDLTTQQRLTVTATHTVLATGGLGQLYWQTTNPAIATGDGMAMAQRAGCTLRDMAFIQFHPTAFYHQDRVRFLISEAMRGEGGLLKNAAGERFLFQYHVDGELAPRDVVSRGLFFEMQRTGDPCVWLEVSHLPAELLEMRFPTILAQCLEYGVDIRKNPIPVAPAAHYVMGGVQVDTHGRTQLPGLYGVGEAVWTGLHGANRLASNSLLECIVLARNVAGAILEAEEASIQTLPPSLSSSPPPAEGRESCCFDPPPELAERFQTLHRLMWDRVGIVRTPDGLQSALTQLQALAVEAQEQDWGTVIPDGVEYLNQLQVAQAITQDALRRPDSVGAHFLVEAPSPSVALYEKVLLPQR